MIRLTHKQANLDPRDIQYVEAHGTGTEAGDIIEINSIRNSFCVDRETPLFVGSIKSNIGHLESASGLAGIMKSILVLEKGYIPPNVNLEAFKQGLGLDKGDIKVGIDPCEVSVCSSLTSRIFRYLDV